MTNIDNYDTNMINLVEVRNEFTTFLVNIVTPLIYEGFKSLYDNAMHKQNELNEMAKNNPNIKNPGVIKIFQIFLTGIPSLNNNEIEKEYNRIKDRSKCSDHFDDLVKSVIRSNITLLTSNFMKSKREYIKDQHFENIQPKDFIHKCCIESAKVFYNNPELFWHNYSTLELKKNQREILELIKLAIGDAIRKLLPMKLILSSYLANEFSLDNKHFSPKINKHHNMNIVTNGLRYNEQQDLEEEDSNMNGFNENEESDDYNDDLSNSDKNIKKMHSKLSEIQKSINNKEKKLNTEEEMAEKLKSKEYTLTLPTIRVSKKKLMDNMMKQFVKTDLKKISEEEEKDKEKDKDKKKDKNKDRKHDEKSEESYDSSSGSVTASGSDSESDNKNSESISEKIEDDKNKKHKKKSEETEDNTVSDSHMNERNNFFSNYMTK